MRLYLARFGPRTSPGFPGGSSSPIGLRPQPTPVSVLVTVLIDVTGARRLLAQHHCVLWLGLLLLLLHGLLVMLLVLLHLCELRSDTDAVDHKILLTAGLSAVGRKV